MISTPDLDGGDFRDRSELVRIHCTYSYTHFNGKPGASALRSNETTVPSAGTFRTGVGRARAGGAGTPAARPAARASPFYEWKAAILNEPRTRSGRPLFARASAGRGAEGRGRRGERGPEAARERERCQILRRGRRWRICSFIELPVRSPRPHPGIRFPAGESQATSPTLLLPATN